MADKFVTYRHIHCSELNGSDAWYQTLEEYCAEHNIGECMGIYVWSDADTFWEHLVNDPFLKETHHLLRQAGANENETVFIDVG